MKSTTLLFLILLTAAAAESDGLAPEITDLNAKDVSYQAEQAIPDLEEPYITRKPQDLEDGIRVGSLGDNTEIPAFVEEIAAGKHGQIDSLLISHRGKLVFESYFRRGRINYPHYQMSITKSYTAMAIGRAIQLGHLTMADLEKPVVEFLKELDRAKLVQGAETITLTEAMNMRSGIRLDAKKVIEVRRKAESLKGQGQIRAYLENSAPISDETQTFKYQGSDPSIAMQVLETAVPGTAREFIETEVLGKLGITSFGWQNDLSGLPKSAAGSSLRSRDMLKWGLLVLNDGKWADQQLLPVEFVEMATGKLHTNAQQTSYGFFWWRHDAQVEGRKIDCKSGRGAGGQFILMFPEFDLIVVVTAHQKGMGKMLSTVPERVLPAFID
ncbi:MAG: CubicO group peptidase (beta-lactamase class C family) [Verrucomicrobiales bacterium]|jgi:CubicO group peptidase (beta-lactamase class C family)